MTLTRPNGNDLVRGLDVYRFNGAGLRVPVLALNDMGHRSYGEQDDGPDGPRDRGAGHRPRGFPASPRSS